MLIAARLACATRRFGSLILLFFLPGLDRSPVRSARFRPIYKQLFWVLVLDCVVLTWVGANTPDAEFHGIPFLWIGRIATLYYFLHFLVILPLLGIFERPRPLPMSISEPVLKGGGQVAGAHAKPMEKA